MKNLLLIVAGICLVMSGCSREEDMLPVYKDAKLPQVSAGSGTKTTGGLVGDPADVTRTTTAGVCLVGGGKDVDAAFKWMIAKSGGGDFVVLRFDDYNGYNSYIYKLGGVNSVETVVIASSSDADDPVKIAKISGAEALFIAGGDQANYVTTWKNTKVETAINNLINIKRIPVGGTSAGCAILGETYFAALNGGVTSDQAMANPYDPLVTLGSGDFLNIPILAHTVTDQHFSQRGREGRMVTFMARMIKDNLAAIPHGIAVDEQTAVCVDNTGNATVYGSNSAFFLQPLQLGPESCVSASPLDWNRSNKALKVYRITGSGRSSATGSFNLNNWTAVSGGTWLYFYVANGTFGTNLVYP